MDLCGGHGDRASIALAVSVAATQLAASSVQACTALPWPRTLPTRPAPAFRRSDQIQAERGLSEGPSRHGPSGILLGQLAACRTAFRLDPVLEEGPGTERHVDDDGTVVVAVDPEGHANCLVLGATGLNRAAAPAVEG